MAGLRERVQGLQTDSSNTDTALATLEEALSEKVRVMRKSSVSIQKKKKRKGENQHSRIEFQRDVVLFVAGWMEGVKEKTLEKCESPLVGVE